MKKFAAVFTVSLLLPACAARSADEDTIASTGETTDNADAPEHTDPPADDDTEPPNDDTAPPAEDVPLPETEDRAGTYVLSSSDFTANPEGCRVLDGTSEEWSIDMHDPSGATWSATEHYGERTNPYTCEQDGDGFLCTSESAFDYNPTGVDADVELNIEYDGNWGKPGSFEGSFELVFTCEGSQCADVASQWAVSEFPCSNNGTFEGSR